jgi:hypothetical protein
MIVLTLLTIIITPTIIKADTTQLPIAQTLNDALVDSIPHITQWNGFYTTIQGGHFIFAYPSATQNNVIHVYVWNSTFDTIKQLDFSFDVQLNNPLPNSPIFSLSNYTLIKFYAYNNTTVLMTIATIEIDGTLTSYLYVLLTYINLYTNKFQILSPITVRLATLTIYIPPVNFYVEMYSTDIYSSSDPVIDYVIYYSDNIQNIMIIFLVELNLLYNAINSVKSITVTNDSGDY